MKITKEKHDDRGFRITKVFVTAAVCTWLLMFSLAFSWYFPGINEVIYMLLPVVPIILCAAVMRLLYRKPERLIFILACVTAFLINIVPAFYVMYGFMRDL